MECQNRHHTLRRLNGKVEKVEADIENIVMDTDIRKEGLESVTAATSATTTSAVSSSSSSSGTRTRTRIDVVDMMSHVSPPEHGLESSLLYDRAAVVACEEPEPERELELSTIPVLTNDSTFTDEKVVEELEMEHPRMDHIIFPSDMLESTLPLSTVSSSFDIRIPVVEVVEEVEVRLSHVQDTNHRETDLLV